MKEQPWYVTLLSWVLYVIGDIISRLPFQTDFLCDTFQKVMAKSSELDKAGKVWGFPKKRSE